MPLPFFSNRSIFQRWLRNALLFASVIAALVTTGLAADLSKSDWAAWVQAVGSIGAIIGAVWVVWWQHNLEASRAEESALAARLRHINAARDLLMWTEDLLKELKVEYVADPLPRHRVRGRDQVLRKLPDAIGAVDRIASDSATSIPVWRGVTEARRNLEELQHLLKWIERLEERNSQLMNRGEKVQKVLDQFRSSMEDARAELEVLAAAEAGSARARPIEVNRSH